MLLKFLSFFLKRRHPCHFQANQLNSFALSLLFQHCSKAWTKEARSNLQDELENSSAPTRWVTPVVVKFHPSEASNFRGPISRGPRGPLLITSTNPPCKDSFRGWCCSPRFEVSYILVLEWFIRTSPEIAFYGLYMNKIMS